MTAPNAVDRISVYFVKIFLNPLVDNAKLKSVFIYNHSVYSTINNNFNSDLYLFKYSFRVQIKVSIISQEDFLSREKVIIFKFLFLYSYKII